MSAARLVLDFPLRPNYVAQVVIPRDLTTEEAKRLCGFIDALAAPYTRTPQQEQELEIMRSRGDL